MPDDARQWAESAIPGGPLLSLYIDAPVPERRWPEESFAGIAKFAMEKLGATVVLLSGSEKNAGNLPVLSHLSIPQLAAAIARSKLLVSNDTGPMHLGPALGIPTLGLFSVGYPEHYRPRGTHSRFLRSEKIEDIPTANVIEHIKEMWAS